MTELYHYGILGMRWGIRKKISSGMQRLSEKLDASTAEKWRKNSEKGADKARKENEYYNQLLIDRVKKLKSKDPKTKTEQDKYVKEYVQEIKKAKYYMKNGGERYLKDKYLDRQTFRYSALGGSIMALINPALVGAGVASGFQAVRNPGNIAKIEKRARENARKYNKKHQINN